MNTQERLRRAADITTELDRADELRVERAKLVYELTTKDKMSVLGVAKQLGLHHAALQQTLAKFGPGTEKAKEVAAAKRARARAEKKSQSDRQGEQSPGAGA